MKIWVSENSSPLPLTHDDDFGKYSHDVDLSPPERSGQWNPSACWVCDTAIVSPRSFSIIEYTHMLVNHERMIVF